MKLLFSSLCAFLLLGAPLQAGETVSSPFAGVRHIVRRDIAPDNAEAKDKLLKDKAAPQMPRQTAIEIVEIDLTTPGLRFLVTPPTPGGPRGDETKTQTTRGFVAQQKAQIGINGGFFRLENGRESRWTNNISLAASDGVIYSPFEIVKEKFEYALNISKDNKATIIRLGDGTPPASIYNAIAGSEPILLDGKNVAVWKELHPRTAVGINREGTKLFLCVVDGRQPAYSMGMTTPELGELLREYGAWNAINLDGGGSSTMVFDQYGDRDENGQEIGPFLVNKPSGERFNGTNLAVFVPMRR
ncbi:MAG: phosphodiester glycosidase family protein [Armatimonadetes bacterium]|nr:phosphodiester glycosidase family protein [Armatimonadota bacterium]